MQPKEYDSFVPGYLSLHQITIVSEQEATSLVLKWTPNQLMNGNTTEEKSASWQSAISIDLKTILFLHCHQVSTQHTLGVSFEFFHDFVILIQLQLR